jgi:biopolymer transport protein ExbB/TolQ
MEHSVFSSLTTMSPMAQAVVVALAVLSVWSLAISFERLVALLKARRQSLAFARSAEAIEAASRAVERLILTTTEELGRGIGGLATIATTAPFIGLFGTVVGIIHAFAGIAATGAGGIGAVSQGIAEALVTTAFGLFVAIPAAWMFNALTHRIQRLGIEMENAASELRDLFSERQGGHHAA